MAINSIGSGASIAGTNDVTQGANAQNLSSTQSTNSAVLDKPGVSPQDGDMLASVMKSLIGGTTSTNSSTLAATTSTTSASASTVSPALAPRVSFQNTVISSILGNSFKVSANQVVSAQSSFAVNSANQLQSSQVPFTNGGTITNFFGLPPSNSSAPGVSPQNTTQLGRTVLDRQGVISFSQNMAPLSVNEKQLVRNLLVIDQVSGNNYLTNIQNLGKALFSIQQAGGLSSSANNLINNTISSLRTAYNQFVTTRTQVPDPDSLYKLVGSTLRTLSNTPGVNQNPLNTAKDILSIGYSNYLLNRLPINGIITPINQVAAPALPLFNEKAPLAQAQSNPSAVFGTNLTSYLNSIGLGGIDAQRDVQYQVNSANVPQAAIINIGNGQNVTLFFSGFPVTSTNPPQAVYSGTAGATQAAQRSSVNPTTQQRLVTFYTNNAGPRANYIQNLVNLTTGFQAIQQNTNDAAAKNAAVQAINALQNALSGLNRTPPIIPNVLSLYQTIGQNIQAIAGRSSALNSIASQVLDTIQRSTFPIGLINYYNRPVTQTQTS